MKTRMAGGKISPKTTLATLLPIVVGVALLIIDKLGVVDIDDELWLGLLLGGPAAGVGAYAARPGLVETDAAPRRRRRAKTVTDS